jgi:uncharacterized membrane protein YfcA
MHSGLNNEILSVGFGMIVGMSLGLTGGGGSMFAIPLLTYGLGVPVGAALGLSLASVGATAGFGAALRLRAREIELRAGLIFAVVGMVVAPIGTMIGHHIAPAILLSAFAVMMGYVGMRMWRKRTDQSLRPGPCVTSGHGKLTAGCYAALSMAGAASGLLSGLFGVGGGFVIVPSLLYAGIKIHQAVATSLMVIFLISVAGVVANIVQGQQFLGRVTALFLGGCCAGMLVGSALRSRLSDSALQKTFAVAMWLVAVFMLAKNLSTFPSCSHPE